MTNMIKTCPICKKKFETNDLRRKFCSKECLPELNKQIELHFLKERWIVLLHYGGDPPECACCGESFYEFWQLTILKVVEKDIGRN